LQQSKIHYISQILLSSKQNLPSKLTTSVEVQTLFYGHKGSERLSLAVAIRFNVSNT